MCACRNCAASSPTRADVRAYPYRHRLRAPDRLRAKADAARRRTRAWPIPSKAKAARCICAIRTCASARRASKRALETTLHGEAGWRKVIVNARGVEMGEDESERREPVRGSGVVLTLDHELQRTAMENFGDQSGSAVVMDIYTGDLLVMASAPGFDPNLFVNGIGQADFDAYNLDEKKPLFHKAVTGAYAPGSTFKMMVGIAAKQAGVEDDWHVSCPGYFPYGGRNFHCWQRGGHGRVDLHNAIKDSCDVYFYQAALRAGPERIAAVARKFGLGAHFDVSVPNIRRWPRARSDVVARKSQRELDRRPHAQLRHRPRRDVRHAAAARGDGRAARQQRPAPCCRAWCARRRASREPAAPPTMTGIEAEYLAARARRACSACATSPAAPRMRAGDLDLVRHPETGADRGRYAGERAAGRRCRSPARPAPRRCASSPRPSARAASSPTPNCRGACATTRCSAASARGMSRATPARSWSSTAARGSAVAGPIARTRSCAQRCCAILPGAQPARLAAPRKREAAHDHRSPAQGPNTIVRAHFASSIGASSPF